MGLSACLTSPELKNAYLQTLDKIDSGFENYHPRLKSTIALNLNRRATTPPMAPHKNDCATDYRLPRLTCPDVAPQTLPIANQPAPASPSTSGLFPSVAASALPLWY